jgi:hypothetical protein
MAGDAAFREWWASYLRMGASPAAAVALTRMNAQVDIRHVLPTVTVPTLVLHRSGDRCVRVEEGRYVAGRIPDARFVELPGDDHLPFVGDADGLLDEIEQFVGEVHPAPGGTRRLATILCATAGVRDAIDSQPLGIMLEMLVRTEAAAFGGASIERIGDRVTITFDGPARAIRCGRALSAAARRHGLPVRIGVHTRECDLIAGVARGSPWRSAAVSREWPTSATCSSLVRSWISWPDPGCGSMTAARTASRTACMTGTCSRPYPIVRATG